jgi:acetolactate synthase-1/2/3 large subunit
MNGAAFLVRALERQGVDVIFGYPGGAILPFYDALVDTQTIRHILVRHEQAAAHAADGYARATGKVGVCVATSGPGATNLVTGIANAYMDSVPIVAITGQVATSLMGTDAFQEVDIFGITLPIVKHSFLIRRVEELPDVVEEAFRLAASGRPGPVLIDLPKDIANTSADQLADRLGSTSAVAASNGTPPERAAVDRAVDLILAARKPVVYAGGGVGIGRAVDELRRFVELSRLPTVTTLKGIGALPVGHPLLLGMMGMHGTKAANTAVQESDLLICVGARFDDRATGKLAEFAPHAKVIHTDIDAAEIGKLRSVQAPIVGELGTTLQWLTEALIGAGVARAPNGKNGTDVAPDRWKRWREECEARRDRSRVIYPVIGSDPQETIDAPRFLHNLAAAAGRDTVVACDVGQHQMWVAQHCGFYRPEHHLTSGGMGTMGFGLPAAIGAQLGRPTTKVINVSGDGSIMMNIQELATIKRYQIPVKIVLIDNQALGMVRQWQELFHAERFSQIELNDNPDFVRLAEAFDIPAFRITLAQEEQAAIERIVASDGPLFVHVRIASEAKVWPLVPQGKSNSVMMERPDSP